MKEALKRMVSHLHLPAYLAPALFYQPSPPVSFRATHPNAPPPTLWPCQYLSSKFAVKAMSTG